MSHPAKIAVIADLHANLPALEAILGRTAECSRIISIGDAVGIGPFPRETLDLLFDSGVELLMGNHEEALLETGHPDHRKQISRGEAEHEAWVKREIDQRLIDRLGALPYEATLSLSGCSARLLHYAYDRWGILRELTTLTPQRLEELFGIDYDLVCFGHTHEPLDVTARAHFVNPGAAGCSTDGLARFATIEAVDGGLRVTSEAAPYDVGTTLRALDDREVPDGKFIKMAFFGV